MDPMKPSVLALFVRGPAVMACLLFCQLVTKADAKDPTADLPPGDLGRVIALGRDIVTETTTHPLSKAYVGNALNCGSCHLDAGTHPRAGSFLRAATAYPAWSPREKRVITLEDRALNCFMRSMNGKRPPNGSEVSVAITTYITWLSTGQKMAMNPNKPLGPMSTPPLTPSDHVPNAVTGKSLYQQHCAACHRADGQGGSDGPPVWGDQSYNRGAGLAGVEKLASWLKVGMPLGDPILTDEQARDIAAYVNSHDRPDFQLRRHLPAADRLGEYNGEVPVE